MQWLKEEGCPWNETACSAAASNGHLGLLQWLRKEGCPWNKNTTNLAGERNHTEVLR
jgi:hypothetical protein